MKNKIMISISFLLFLIFLIFAYQISQTEVLEIDNVLLTIKEIDKNRIVSLQLELLKEIEDLRMENDYLKNLQALVLEDERRQRKKRR